MILRPGFKIEPRDRIVVVDDVLTTGGSVLKLIDLSRRCQAQTVAAAFIIDRSAMPIDFGVPTVSLAKIDIPTYTSDKCPMCKEGTPLVEPVTVAHVSRLVIEEKSMKLIFNSNKGIGSW